MKVWFFSLWPHKMGRVRWCQNCHTTHEQVPDSKCHKFDETQLDSPQDIQYQASNVTFNESLVTEEQARLVVQQYSGSICNLTRIVEYFRKKLAS